MNCCNRTTSPRRALADRAKTGDQQGAAHIRPRYSYAHPNRHPDGAAHGHADRLFDAGDLCLSAARAAGSSLRQHLSRARRAHRAELGLLLIFSRRKTGIFCSSMRCKRENALLSPACGPRAPPGGCATRSIPKRPRPLTPFNGRWWWRARRTKTRTSGWRSACPARRATFSGTRRIRAASYPVVLAGAFHSEAKKCPALAERQAVNYTA